MISRTVPRRTIMDMVPCQWCPGYNVQGHSGQEVANTLKQNEVASKKTNTAVALPLGIRGRGRVDTCDVAKVS